MHPTTDPAPTDLKSRLDELADRVDQYLSADDREAALAVCREMLALNGAWNHAHVLMARVMMPGENYAGLLGRLHRHLQPSTYAEIGVATGASMAIAAEATRCVGIDPCPRVTAAIKARARLYPVTSDAFFERYDLLEELGAESLDFAFIDGLHLFEQALRDFINLEKYAAPHTVVAIHDCYPPTELSADRERVMAYWAGDVWRLIPCLVRHRPDLQVAVVPALPSGVGLVTGLDRHSTVLEDRFDDIVEEFLALPYAELESGREALLNTIPNTWDAVQARLPA
jgi:predicted O-methyltransferase YrrM